MKATDVLWLSTCDASKYPLAKKQQSMEFLREIAHLRCAWRPPMAVSKHLTTSFMCMHQPATRMLHPEGRHPRKAAAARRHHATSIASTQPSKRCCTLRAGTHARLQWLASSRTPKEGAGAQAAHEHNQRGGPHTLGAGVRDPCVLPRGGLHPPAGAHHHRLGLRGRWRDVPGQSPVSPSEGAKRWGLQSSQRSMLSWSV